MRFFLRPRILSKHSFVLTCAAGLGFALLQCGLVSDGMTVGGESHFLRVCETSSDCGSAELSCLCNVCTKPCTGNNDCGALSSSAALTCAPSTCTGGGNVCELTCVADHDCSALGEHYQCVGHVCRTGTTPDPTNAPGSGGSSNNPSVSRNRPGHAPVGTGGVGVVTPVEPPTGGAAGVGGSGGTPPICMDAPDDLVAWWPGDTDGADLVGSHHGALEGTAVAASNGHVGGSFYFDGGGYLEVPDAPALNVGTGHFSLAFWIRTTQGNFGMILGKIHDDNGEVRGYQAWIDFGSIGFELGSQVNVNYASGALINDGLWHFVAITANRTVPDGLTFYVDGVAVGSYDISFLSGSADNPSPLRIGVHSDSLNNYLTGDVDEAQLYKTVLSAEEVEALYEAGTAGVCKVLP